MKYLVVVNCKYIVSVNAHSACSAEHVVLDNISGSKYAQAFDAESMRTDTFMDFMLTCETTSFDQLMSMGEKYDECRNRYHDARERVVANKLKLKALSEEMDRLNAETVKLIVEAEKSEAEAEEVWS